MIRIYCDWCNKEATAGGASGTFSKRVATENGKLNVVISFEFLSNDKPEHLCIACFSEKAITAARKLAMPQENPNE